MSKLAVATIEHNCSLLFCTISQCMLLHSHSGFCSCYFCFHSLEISGDRHVFCPRPLFQWPFLNLAPLVRYSRGVTVTGVGPCRAMNYLLGWDFFKFDDSSPKEKSDLYIPTFKWFCRGLRPRCHTEVHKPDSDLLGFPGLGLPGPARPSRTWIIILAIQVGGVGRQV